MTTRIATAQAFVLLADAVRDGMPAPVDVSFAGDWLMLKFATLADGHRWLTALGADRAHVGERNYLGQDGTMRRRLGHSPLDTWHGWGLSVWAAEDLPMVVTKSTALVAA